MVIGLMYWCGVEVGGGLKTGGELFRFFNLWYPKSLWTPVVNELNFADCCVEYGVWWSEIYSWHRDQSFASSSAKRSVCIPTIPVVCFCEFVGGIALVQEILSRATYFLCATIAVCAYRGVFGMGHRMLPIPFFPRPTPVAMATIFGTKWAIWIEIKHFDFFY